MTTSIGGVTVADPKAGYDGIEARQIDSSVLLELADGTVVAQHTNSRWQYTVRWENISEAEMTTLQATLVMATDLELTLPNFISTHQHVFIVPSSYRRSEIDTAAGTSRWRAEIQFVEIA